MADEEQKQNLIPRIRTMRTDAELYVRQKKISKLDMARSAYAAGVRAIPAAPRSWIKPVMYIVLVLIVVVGGYFLYRIYFINMIYAPKLEATKKPASFLPVDDTKTISVSESTPGSLIPAISAELQKELKIGSMVYFPIKVAKTSGPEEFAAAQDIISLVSWQPPKDFLNTLAPEFNLLVAYTQSGGSFVIVMKTNNFDGALAALLAWEKTMWLDFKPFLSPADAQNIAQFTFGDEVIKNNDARVLRDAMGKAILGYSIFNRQYIIFSNSRAGLTAALERFIAAPPR